MTDMLAGSVVHRAVGRSVVCGAGGGGLWLHGPVGRVCCMRALPKPALCRSVAATILSMAIFLFPFVQTRG